MYAILSQKLEMYKWHMAVMNTPYLNSALAIANRVSHCSNMPNPGPHCYPLSPYSAV